MSDFTEAEKRQFVRVPVEVPVDYRFISQTDPSEDQMDQVSQGHTQNVGAGGLLLVGAIPEPGLIADLLMQKVIVGLEVRLPEHEPIRILSRVAWVEAIDEEKGTCSMGLRFKEIAAGDQDDLFRFVITSRMG